MPDQKNPLADLGTAAVTSPLERVGAVPAGSANPLADLGTQAVASPLDNVSQPPVEKPLGERILSNAADVGVGFVKGMGDTVSTVSHLINKIPVVGETLAPSEGIQAMDILDESKNNYQRVGKGLETGAELALTAGAAGEIEALKAVQAAEKLTGAARAAEYVRLAKQYPILADTFNLATNHPWLSKMILEGTKGAIAGGVVGGNKERSAKGAATGAAVGAATGAAVAASPLLLNPFKRAANAAQDYIADIWQGSKVAQAPAKEALREGVQAGAQVPVAQPPALRQILEQPVEALENAASKNYKAMDVATGGKFQPNVDALKNVNNELRSVAGTNEAREAELEATKIRLEWQRDQLLNEAEAKGVPKETVQLAKTQFRQAQALQDVESKVFKNLGVIDLDGNVRVDAALKALQKLQDNTTWGAPRLEQAFGKDVANALLKSLQEARQQGLQAVSRQQWALRAAKLAGAAGALTYGKDILHLIAGAAGE